MANAYKTLAELVKINDQNLADIDVSDLLESAPLLKAMASVEASNGTLHKYLKETTTSGAGFRDVNDGIENTASVDTLVTVTLEILGASFSVDRALARAYYKGADAFVSREAQRKIKKAFATAEAQIIYGTGSNSAGFAGLIDNGSFDDLDDTMVVDAGGTTADTASSCFLMRSAEDGAAVVMGEDGNIEIGETTTIEKAGSTGFYPALYTPIDGWAGLQVGGAYDIVRIANLTEDSGKGLTDALLYEAISMFKADLQPNIIAMNRRSLEQLRASRTATNATGAPAPIPTEVEGIKIVVSDQISSTEALEVDAA